MIPGMIPPRKILAMEVLVMMPKRMKGMLGGMMMPITAAEAQMAAARGPGKPCFFMGGMRSPPMAAVSATAEPQMPPKNMLVILTVVFRKNVQMHNEILKIIEESKDFTSHTVGFEVDACSSVTTYKFRLVGREDAGWVKLYETLRMLDDVCKVGLEESPIP